MSLLSSFTVEYLEELLDVLFNTIVNFPFIIFLPFRLLFPKLPHCQFTKSGKIHKMIFKEKIEIGKPYAQDYNGDMVFGECMYSRRGRVL